MPPTRRLVLDRPLPSRPQERFRTWPRLGSLGDLEGIDPNSVRVLNAMTCLPALAAMQITPRVFSHTHTLIIDQNVI